MIDSIECQDIQKLIAVIKSTFVVDPLQSIGISIKCNTKIGMMGKDRLHQCLWVGSAYVLVDIDPIGGASQRDDLST